MLERNLVRDERLWLLLSVLGIALLHLSLSWRSLGDIDYLTTSGVFWCAIIWLLWCRRDRHVLGGEAIANWLGLFLLGLILTKTLSLFWFEAVLLPLFPVGAMLALSLIAAGWRGVAQYCRELFLLWFLFFPEGVIGQAIDGLVHITVLNAKFATYLLYYVGFEVASQGNQVLLSLPELGEFKAIVDYPCAGVPMILLMLKLSLLLVSVVSVPRRERLLIPLFAIALGFFLGVVRVCILTLLIPNQAQFDYWHGAQGSQIFSTLAIVIFAGFCQWILGRRLQPKNSD